MANSSEDEKLSAKENNKDRISSISDDVLCHILSFLPTKTAVATSKLSKRWRFLWTCVPKIDVDDDIIAINGSSMDFRNILNKILSSRNGECGIKRFRLKTYGIEWKPNYNDKWIDAAIERRVEELNLSSSFGNWGDYEIPDKVFKCTTIVVLKLSGVDVMMNAPSSVHLPNLKVLHLRVVKYKEDQSIRNLLAGCPVLEELLVERGDPDNILDYEITAPSLKSLMLMFENELEDDHDTLVRVNKVHLKSLCNLVEAKINVYPYDDLLFEDYAGSLDVIRALYNVKFLELSQSTMGALRCDTNDNFPAFHNLVRLTLDGFCCYWGLLIKFLQNSPFLKHLTMRTLAKIHKSCACQDCETECWIQPAYVPACLSSCLATCCIGNGFMGLEDDMQFVGYILENSMVLENMTIAFWPELDLNKKFVVQQKVEMIEKGYEKCLLKFD